MSHFDPDAFMAGAVTGSNDTKMLPVPEGEYVAVAEDVTPRRSKDGNSTMLDVKWKIMDGALAAEIGRDNITVRQTVFLDMTPSGTLDMGKGRNTQLGKLREAVGLNDPMKPFAPAMLRGVQAKVRVTQRPDPNNPDVIYNDVKGVTSAI